MIPVFEINNGVVKELVHQGSGKDLKGFLIFGREFGFEVGEGFFKLSPADLFGLLPQGHDGGIHLELFQPVFEFEDFFFDNSFGSQGLFFAKGKVFFYHGFKVVNVINKDVFDFIGKFPVNFAPLYFRGIFSPDHLLVKEVKVRFDVITIFPEYFESPLKVGALKKAQDKGLIEINLINLRDFALDKHKMVDDRPFGGGEGMVFKPEPLYRAISNLKKEGKPYVIYLSPQGRLLNQEVVKELFSKGHLVLICGRYEGIDERIRRYFIDDEISIGDYVVFGGEVAALVVIEAVSRLVPGVVGKKDSVEKETFSQGLLKYPQYTRPRDFLGYKVPEVLLSGDHAAIEKWRREKSLEITFKRRPDLLKKAPLTPEDKAFLKKLGWQEEDA